MPAEARQLQRMMEDAPGEEESRGLQMRVCPSEQGLADYLREHRTDYNIKAAAREWDSCNNNIRYTREEAGSILSYLSILDHMRILVYSGDFDDQVPLLDTLKNL